MYGRWHRVQIFLLGLLTEATRRRYSTALLAFENWCAEFGVEWQSLPQETQDWVIADYALHQYDEDELPLASLRDLVAGLQRS